MRAITDAAGAKVESAFYKPFGEQTQWLSPAAPAPEAKGWIGERYDASAGLQYLNARYYDPELGMFLQPDWFEVTEPGVRRNRYSYSFNDPVNKRDPGGDAQCGASLSGHEEACNQALDAADNDRDALEKYIDYADELTKLLLAGDDLDELGWGISGFRKRLESSYGPITTENLATYVGMARAAADGIGARGEGVVMEHLGLAEDALRARYPGISVEKLNNEMNTLFGEMSFLTSLEAEAALSGYAGRYSGAQAWANINSTGPILLDRGFSGQAHVIGHEVGHIKLGLQDFHNLDGNGYGSAGIAAALKAGVQWQNADSFACVIKGGC